MLVKLKLNMHAGVLHALRSNAVQVGGEPELFVAFQSDATARSHVHCVGNNVAEPTGREARRVRVSSTASHYPAPARARSQRQVNFNIR